MVLNLLRVTNVSYTFNAPYSPEYNAIELFWALFKKYLRRMYIYEHLDFDDMLQDALLAVTPEQCFNIVQHTIKHYVSNNP
jgi:transposase